MPTEHLSDDDRAVLEYLDKEGTDGAADDVQLENLPKDELIEFVQDQQDEIAGWKQVTKDLAAEHRELKEEFEGQQETVRFLVSKVNEIDDRVEGRDPTRHLTTLEKYARKSREERKRDLNAKTYRATVIFENWTEWAESVGDGQTAISTQKRRGQNAKLALKVDLENGLDEDVTLQSVQIHRAMKELARTSAQEPDEISEDRNEAGRLKIEGGAFTYQERLTPDNSTEYKVVTLENPDMVTLP